MADAVWRADGSDDASLERDRRGNIAQLGLEVGSLAGTVGERRIDSNSRDDKGFAALQHLFGDAFPPAASRVPAGVSLTGGHLEIDVTRVGPDEDDRAADGAMMAAKNLEHAMEPGLQVRSPRECLARLEKR